jgi:uncharacterized protein (TIGR03084 family)
MTPTPSPGWSVADQLAHLAYFDRNAALAIEQPEEFVGTITALLEAASASSDGMDRFTLDAYRNLPAAELLAQWRQGREELRRAAATLTDEDRVQWYGPSMSARSFLTARLMEVWAHGDDICAALHIERPPTDRIRHVAQLGVITRAWSYLNRGLEPPETEVSVTLTAPSGEVWAWGAAAADSTISGPAVDFCLVVTQRRNLADTRLAVVGDAAQEWMQLAQAFAGPPTDGRSVLC